ncbi:hypothetical protein [Nocardia araoensis]|uniref:hypothetical protein n=1 Tax=Nocardia araoensis TaxID=228600 RepID=UPI0003021B40|nr:hypothetical protein [Nocardia araoensis]
MTTPESEFSPAQTVAQWQGQLLMRIRLLAAEHTRITDAGWEKFEALTSDGDQQSAWQAHLDGLEAQREQAEQTALTAGIEAAWIADARELGRHSTRPRVEAGVRENPVRDNAAQDFYIDMLSLDLWHLERMAALAAARADRIATGRWSFGTNPGAAAQFARNMQLYHQRVTALAHAAQFTATEADMFWGPAAEGARRGHAVHLETYTELDLVAEWNAYAAPSPDLAIPPYVPTDPDTGTPTAGAEVTPPTPQQMIDTAAASLRARFVDAALHNEHADADSGAAAAITAAVDAAVATAEHAWDTEPDPSHHVGDARGPTELGIDPY